MPVPACPRKQNVADDDVRSVLGGGGSVNRLLDASTTVPGTSTSSVHTLHAHDTREKGVSRRVSETLYLPPQSAGLRVRIRRPAGQARQELDM